MTNEKASKTHVLYFERDEKVGGKSEREKGEDEEL